MEGPPARRRLVVQPRLADLRRAEGVVLTESGPVSVSWKRRDGGTLDFSFSVPAGVAGEVFLPAGANDPRVMVNGRTVAWERRGRHVVIKAGAGEYAGMVTG